MRDSSPFPTQCCFPFCLLRTINIWQFYLFMALFLCTIRPVSRLIRLLKKNLKFFFAQRHVSELPPKKKKPFPIFQADFIKISISTTLLLTQEFRAMREAYRPTVQNRMLAWGRGSTDSKRTLYPQLCPGSSPLSWATRSATETALILRGCGRETFSLSFINATSALS